ncbi:MAG TPA: hypothetical protein VI855_05175 [Dehalococcoidia bacterium]|nr:hypothetical protein [Dehalococcoidia bacterium]
MAQQTGILKWESQTILARLDQAMEAQVFPRDSKFNAGMRQVFAQIAVLYQLDPLMGEIMPYQGRVFITIAGRRRLDDRAGRRASFRFEPLTKDELQAYIDTAGFSQGDTPARCIATALDGRVVERVARIRADEGGNAYLPTVRWRYEMACKRAERQCREILWGPVANPLDRYAGQVIEGEPGIEAEPSLSLPPPAMEGDNPAAPLYERPRQAPQEPRPVPAGPAPAPTPAQPAATPAGHCEGHDAPMVKSRRTGKVAHVLDDKTVCEGIPATSPQEDRDSSMPSPDEGADDPVDLPPSQAQDLDGLKAAVAAEGMTWENFQRNCLKMVWAEWVKIGGTVSGAWERIPLRQGG